MTSYVLLANLRRASTNWWKVNKNKKFIIFNVVLYCYYTGCP